MLTVSINAQTHFIVSVLNLSADKAYGTMPCDDTNREIADPKSCLEEASRSALAAVVAEWGKILRYQMEETVIYGLIY